jgi:outer membrane receptor protein involved in Fe transport
MSVLSRSTLLVALTLGTVQLAAAQVPDTARKDTTAVVLKPIEVVGTIQPFAGPSVTGGVPARVTILSGAEVDAAEPRLLSDVLGLQAGFSTYDDLGSPYKLNVSSRGFYASPVVGLGQGIAVFLDGVRQNEPDAAQVNFDLLPLEHVKRVELLSGNGTLLGRNALGGAVNLVTRSGDGPMEGEIEVMGGTQGARSLETSFGALTKGGLDWYVGAGYNAEDGWRQVTKAEQSNLFLNLGKSGETSGIRFQSYVAKSWAQTAGSLPETVFETVPDSNLSAQDFEDLYNVQVALLGYKNVGKGRASFNLYNRWHGAERFNANQPTDPDVFGRSKNRVTGGTVDYRVGFLAGSNPVGLRFGVDGSTASTEVQLFADSTKFGGGRPQTTFVKSPVWDLAGFVSGDISFGRVTLSAGGRYDYVKAPFRNQLDPERDTTQTFKRFNPRGGIDVNAGGGVSVFGSVGTGFRAPSVIEIACADPEEPCPLPFALGDDPPIKPVTTTTYEVGARYLAGSVLLSASMYRTDVKDDIYLFPFEEEDEPEGSTIDGYFGNLDKTRREGIELSGRYFFGKAGDAHSLYLNYGYTRATFQTEAEIFSIREDEDAGIENEAEPGDRLPLVPDHQVKGGFNLRFANGLRAGADARYIGKQFLRGDEANDTDPMKGYFTADARLGYEIGPWELTLVLSNVFGNERPVFGGFNINQGNPGGPTLERFLTPPQKRQLRAIFTWAFGRDRD